MRTPTHRSRAPRGAALLAAGVVGVALGVAVAALGDRDQVPNRPEPGPAVTVTATASPPITAPSIETESAAPVVDVSPTLDLDARSIDDPASIWVVVNKQRPVDPLDWAPAELVTVPGGGQMTPEAADALAAMSDAAREDGAAFSVGTAYRSHGFQASLHADYVAQWGAERALTFSARAGYSEHQTGLAADLYQSAACRLQPCFGDEEAGVWLRDHAHEHGFVIRYLEGADAITGYRYEPWHVRYVGRDLATYVHERGLTLEEAFGLDPAPDYG